MAFLLDTQVISEPKKKIPNSNVLRWLKDRDVEEIYLSIFTIGEIRRGIQLLGNSHRKQKFLQWIEEIEDTFENQILGIDLALIDQWAKIHATASKKGLTLPIFDSLIAVTALTHDLTLVTRNEKDMVATGVRILNPWK